MAADKYSCGEMGQRNNRPVSMTEMEAQPEARTEIAIMPIKTMTIMPIKTVSIMSVKTASIMSVKTTSIVSVKTVSIMTISNKKYSIRMTR
jgi:hypothetical protein